jgi:hypothetical protein
MASWTRIVISLLTFQLESGGDVGHFGETAFLIEEFGVVEIGTLSWAEARLAIARSSSTEALPRRT